MTLINCVLTMIYLERFNDRIMITESRAKTSVGVVSFARIGRYTDAFNTTTQTGKEHYS